MTRRIRVLAPDDSLQFARGLFVWSGIRHAPVVLDDDLVGVLSDRDLAWHIARAQVEDLASVTVSEAMTTEVQTAGPDDGLTEAAARMAQYKIGCLPITEKGELVGIVTTTDILTGEVEQATMPSEPGPMISEVMATRPVTVRADDHLVDAAAKMVGNRIRHLPVVDVEGRAIGMLSDRDVRQIVGDLRRSKQEVRQELARFLVRDAMSTPVVSVPLESSLADAAQKFADYQIGAVVVAGADDKLAGIASYIDVLQGLAAAIK